MENIKMQPIGIINTPFNSRENMPIQPNSKSASQGTITIGREYKDGLKDLEGFSHIILIYYLHHNKGFELLVTPFMDNKEHGIFATRSPHRPNSIGLSIVELESIESNIIQFRGADMLNGTPLLDIKPYVPAFDSPDVSSTGWIPQNGEIAENISSDDRFI